jgi:hypothetical protein
MRDARRGTGTRYACAKLGRYRSERPADPFGGAVAMGRPGIVLAEAGRAVIGGSVAPVVPLVASGGAGGGAVAAAASLDMRAISAPHPPSGGGFFRIFVNSLR